MTDAPLEPTPVDPAPVDPTPTDESPIDDAIADDAAAARRGRVGPLGVAAAIVFGLFYAYVLWSALSRLIDLPNTFTAKGVDGVPWAAAVAALLVPIIVYVLAFVLGLRRNVGHKALIYIAGLAAVAALSLSLIGFENYALVQALAAK